MKFKEIVFVTGNKKKAKEAEEILGIPLKVLDIELDEIQDLDLEKVALHKLNQAYELVGGPVIVDDMSVEVDAWFGFPGPLIKWVIKADQNLLLKLLREEKNRKARTRLAIGFHDGKNPHIFYGVVSGEISKESKGANGFGWDPLFIPEGQDKTYAEMNSEEKNKISHRKIALDKLKEYLDSH